MAVDGESYANTVAPPVSWGDEDATAEQVIRVALVGAHAKYVTSEHVFDNRVLTAQSGGELQAALQQYTNAISAHLLDAVAADLLLVIGQLAPDKVDEIARGVVAKIQSGDFYPEQVWEWLTERGIDPDRIRTETVAAIAAGKSNA